MVANEVQTVVKVISLYLWLSARSRNTGFTEYRSRRSLDGMNSAILSQISRGIVGTMAGEKNDK